MTKEAIEKRLDEIDKHRFYLAMDDHWSKEMYDMDWALVLEANNLKKQLAEMTA